MIIDLCARMVPPGEISKFGMRMDRVAIRDNDLSKHFNLTQLPNPAAPAPASADITACQERIELIERPAAETARFACCEYRHSMLLVANPSIPCIVDATRPPPQISIGTKMI